MYNERKMPHRAGLNSKLSSKEKNMFTFDETIDAVQKGKKVLINTFVTNETIAKSMNSFVDAQTEYTKKAFKAGSDTAETFFLEASKLDFAKIFNKSAK
jgi:hypothetical protein